MLRYAQAAILFTQRNRKSLIQPAALKNSRRNTRSSRVLSRRRFLPAAALSILSGYSSVFSGNMINHRISFKTKNPSRALVVWFSQTGHTERIGRLIAACWRKTGLNVDEGDIRDIRPAEFSSYDLIAAGSPVYYYDMAEPLRDWLNDIPQIEGTAVVSFATFGGPGHNQHNTACGILDILSRRGGVPAAMDTFGNMSTFAPTWSTGRTARILKYSHLPDENTYERVRAFSSGALDLIASGTVSEIDYEKTIFSVLKRFGTAEFTKKLARSHAINSETCVRCLMCEARCPARAIDISSYSVDRKKCIFCVGCVNLCPVGAHEMTFMGSRVYGFSEFLNKNGVVIREPEELSRPGFS